MNVLVTGGAGFIGCNAVVRLLNLGHRVTVLDNLFRPSSKQNLIWLQQIGGFEFVQIDIRNFDAVSTICANGQFDAVIHLAAQVAVTTSIVDPRSDFGVNALGTFNLLEAIRRSNPSAVVIYASTNKVYGQLHGLSVREGETRYEFANVQQGVNETQSLDFYSPYGCSKGAADQYMIDYARIYGLKTVTLRQSCIYGYHQFGIEDQGWVAWFIIAHVLNKPITIYGDGKQVRDVLFVDDLVDCFLTVIDSIDSIAGQVFNIGGGPANTTSLLEFIEKIENLSGRKVEYSFSDWRPGDQPIYISDISSAITALKWEPKIGVEQGISRLYDWVVDNKDMFKELTWI